MCGVCGRAGWYIDELQLLTNSGRTLRFGARSRGGDDFRFDIKPTWQLVGFYGSIGLDFHELGVVVARVPFDFRRYAPRLPRELRETLRGAFLLALRVGWHNVRAHCGGRCSCGAGRCVLTRSLAVPAREESDLSAAGRGPLCRRRARSLARPLNTFARASVSLLRARGALIALTTCRSSF